MNKEQYTKVMIIGTLHGVHRNNEFYPYKMIETTFR